jgi:hypothetical protein
VKVLIAITSEATVAYWVSDDGPAEPVATVVNHGMTVDQVADLGISLIGALSLNGPKRPVKPSLPARPAKSKAAPPTKRRRTRTYGVTFDIVLAAIREHPGSTAREMAQYVDAPPGESGFQAVNRRALELRDAGLITFGERQEGRGRPGPHLSACRAAGSTTWRGAG